MSNQYVFNDRLPLAPLKIAALESCRDLAQKVNDHIVNFRRNDAEELLRRQGNLQYRGYDVDSYLLDCACPRFGSGEAKGIVNESVRGTDIFCMVDVTNHSLTYKMSGYVNHCPRIDHYQDLKENHRRYGIHRTPYQRYHAVPLREPSAQAYSQRVFRLCNGT